MKRKESLLLIELLLMIGVFALSAGVCLRIFAGAASQSKKNAALDRSVVEAQNAAELLMHTGGDFPSSAELYGGVWDGERWVIRYDRQWSILPENRDTSVTGDMADACYVLVAQPAEESAPLLEKGTIAVYSVENLLISSENGDFSIPKPALDPKNTEIFSLTVAWQAEEGEYGA